MIARNSSAVVHRKKKNEILPWGRKLAKKKLKKITPEPR